MGEIRKVVTVVFTDLVGSTSLGERLDPEALRQVMTRYFDEMQAVLERHGGTVEKFIGDAIMAVFGIPTLHEDDALRAVRAAVEMRERLARLNEELEQSKGVRISTRTGINTGEVVAGDAEARQQLATGDAVNVAARLEQAAEQDEILLGDETYRRAREAVRVEPLEPLALKGKSEPLAAYRLVELLPDVPAFTRPIDAPFVGRTDELTELKQAFENAATEHTCQLATIVGPPGIGKSRLARELVGAVGDEARVLVGRCLPYGEGITYWPLAEIVQQLAGPDPEPRLAELLVNDEQATLVAPRIAGAIRAGGTAGSPEETAWAFRKLFEALASERPLLVVVDDIHWAEPTLLDLLEYLVAFSSGAPILLLCLARPDLFDDRPSWAAPRANTTLVSLAPLSVDDAQSLISGLQRQVGDDSAKRIVEAAEGNPLFMEQMLALQAEDPSEELVVPPSIQALLAARIDRLEPEERAVVERASVEGRMFHRSAVAELLPPEARGGMGTQLLSLIRKEFLRPDRALFAGDDGFRFNHVLIRDAAYDSMPKQLRAELHERYATWLAGRADGRIEEFEEILAHHLEDAYRYRAELGRIDESAELLASRAGRLLTRAGRRASNRGDARLAVRLLQRAVDLLSVEPRARAEAMPDYGLALREAGELEAALGVLDEAVHDAQRYGDRRSELRADVQRGYVLGFLATEGSLEKARAAAERAVEGFGELRDDGELAGALVLLGIVESWSGNGAAAVAAHRRALRHARAVGDDRREVEIWNELGGAMLFSRTPITEVLTFLTEEKAWAKRKGFLFLEADALLGGGYILPMFGRFDEGRDQLEWAKSIFFELGAAYNVAEAHWAGAQLELLAGELETAEAELREALRIHLDMGASRYSAMVRALLAHVLYAQRRDPEAFELLDEAREEGKFGDTLSYEVLWRTALAKLVARRGETSEGARLAREAISIVAATDKINLHGDALVDLAEVLRAGGEEAGALEALEQAAALYEEKGNELCAERARSASHALEGIGEGS